MAVSIGDIVTFDVTEEMIGVAKKIRAERDTKYGNIFSEEPTDLRYVGEIGEIVLNNALKMVYSDGTEWHTDDVVNKPDFTFCNRKIDIKTVKRQVPVKPWYKAQITARHIDTPVDDLVFACFEQPVRKLHLLGVMEKEDFLRKATYFGEGEHVHENYQIRKDHEIYAIMISKMTPIREYLKENKNKYLTMKSVA